MHIIDTERKNIAVIVPRLCDGGAERTAGFIAYQLNEDYNVFLFVFDADEIMYPYKGELINVNIPATKNWVYRVINLIKRIIRVKTLKTKFKIDISISFMEGADLVNCLTKGEERVITSIRNHKSHYAPHNFLLKYLDKLIYRYVANKSDVIVALSKGVAMDLIDYYKVSPGKVVSIYNPCDTDTLEKESTVIDGDEKKYSVVTMGRLVKEKGQWHLIRAFKNVIEKYPNAVLDILGDGPLKEELLCLIKNLNLENNVRLIGYIRGPHQFIKKHEIFVFPSITEGLGYSLIEAVCCGMPCIADDCMYGPREILAPGTEIKGELDELEYAEAGILTSKLSDDYFNATSKLSHAEEQLAEAICVLLGNPVLRLKYHNAAIARSYDFRPANIMSQWKGIL